MSLMINQNITALNAWKNLGKTDRAMGSTMEKLSSGLRINKAADDPSGLVISEQMRAQVVGLKAAIKNSEKGVSMIQTAEGALDKVHALLDKMRGLALDSANSATSDSKMLAANQAEISNILQTITRISENTTYGTKKLLDGSNSTTATVTAAAQTGMNAASVSNITSPDATYSLTTAKTATGDIAPTLGGNLLFDAANEAASAATTGTHTIRLAGSFESFTVGSDNFTGGLNASMAATSYFTADNSKEGNYNVEITSIGADGNTAGGATFGLKVTGPDGYSKSFSNVPVTDAGATGTFTLADTVQGYSFDVALDEGVYAAGQSFNVDVKASTAQMTLNGDAATALSFNSHTDFTTLADQAITDSDGNKFVVDMTTIVAADFTTPTTSTFAVTHDAYTATLTNADGDSNVVAFEVDRDGVANNVAVDDGKGHSMTVDFGKNIRAGTSSIAVTDNSLIFQIGANQSQTVSISIASIDASKMAVVADAEAGSTLAGVTTATTLAGVDVSTAQGAQDAITLIDAAIDQVSVLRGNLGAFQANTLEANLDSLRVASENLQSSESTIRDTDMAAEMATFTKYQVMMQAGVAMLAQANQSPNNLLTLLRG